MVGVDSGPGPWALYARTTTAHATHARSPVTISRTNPRPTPTLLKLYGASLLEGEGIFIARVDLCLL